MPGRRIVEHAFLDYSPLRLRHKVKFPVDRSMCRWEWSFKKQKAGVTDGMNDLCRSKFRNSYSEVHAIKISH